MFSRVFMMMVAVVVAAVSLTAQTGRREAAQGEIGKPMTIFEQFAARLGLDGRTQTPAAEEIFQGAVQQASPLVQRMEQIRIQMVNAELAKLRSQPTADADREAAVKAYAEVATQMAKFESQAFMKVHALLKPDQHERVPEAFATMAGILLPAPPSPPRPPR